MKLDCQFSARQLQKLGTICPKIIRLDQFEGEGERSAAAAAAKYKYEKNAGGRGQINFFNAQTWRPEGDAKRIDGRPVKETMHLPKNYAGVD